MRKQHIFRTIKDEAVRQTGRMTMRRDIIAIALAGIAITLFYFGLPNKDDPSPYTINKVTGHELIWDCDSVKGDRLLIWDCVARR